MRFLSENLSENIASTPKDASLNFDGLVKSDISHKALREHGANLFKILKISLRALVRQAKPG